MNAVASGFRFQRVDQFSAQPRTALVRIDDQRSQQANGAKLLEADHPDGTGRRRRDQEIAQVRRRQVSGRQARTRKPLAGAFEVCLDSGADADVAAHPLAPADDARRSRAVASAVHTASPAINKRGVALPISSAGIRK